MKDRYKIKRKRDRHRVGVNIEGGQIKLTDS